mgnify:CR=1 FL=1
MQYRRLLALTLALALAGPASGDEARHAGTFIWREGGADFGGFSGIEVTDGGTRFHALTDRAHIFWGEILRDDEGRIREMRSEGSANLRGPRGAPLAPGHRGDSEGLAIAGDGSIWVSFEGDHRVARYPAPDEPPTETHRPPDPPGASRNAGYEALALDDRGRPVIVPEGSASPDAPFPVLVLEGGSWRSLGAIPRRGRFLPVGSDFGPDGRFYLLERDFLGPLGFASRVRSMILHEDGARDEIVLMQSSPLQYDNLEGISVWDDGAQIRMTLISDDNFLFLQRTEVVEYVLAPGGRHARRD